MQDDSWRRGDLAFCISQGTCWGNNAGINSTEFHEGPECGQCLTVSAVTVLGGITGLGFVEFPNGFFYVARHFMKVTPPSDMILDLEEREIKNGEIL